VSERTVSLRAERIAANARYLSAYMGEDGGLVLAGHDLGSAAGGEYEWSRKCAAETPAEVDRGVGW